MYVIQGNYFMERRGWNGGTPFHFHLYMLFILKFRQLFNH